MKIGIGGDHAGFEYKNEIVKHLQAQGYEVEDFGPHSPSSVDYPDHVHPLAQSIEEKKTDFGILICGSANGVAITANKHQGIRAGLCWEVEVAELIRLHNDANIICLPARFVSLEKSIAMVDKFLTTEFEGGRHQTRVDKISCN
ncbi:ribose 5-phosphate isomerase B [Reichenbachiella agarivorans]|uniref:Ribose 5-phosphate isomerase B n=1 Tax=Reichenbachiella agarivorans TaxID=2979464 RepID=A0ABY6CJ98_9BACT|nr:ribose 5-phosphate isomerase B [Reichenbachiella agarivorans]UXP30552.1 ribose 5-phosphate isomerase B [Reichenbachiella agarivorans]